MEEIAVDVQRPRCPYCHDDVIPGEGRGCAECMGWTHEECWDEHGSCPACSAKTPLPPVTIAVQEPVQKPVETTEELADRAHKEAGQRSSNRILLAILVSVLLATLASLIAMLAN